MFRLTGATGFVFVRVVVGLDAGSFDVDFLEEAVFEVLVLCKGGFGAAAFGVDAFSGATCGAGVFDVGTSGAAFGAAWELMKLSMAI